LKHWILAIKRVVYPLYEFVHYRKIIWRNNAKRLIGKKIDNIFLFILCPPFSGSTLLHEVLSTSASVSPNNTLGTREGQQLPKVREMMWDKEDHYNLEEKYDWDLIKNEWLKYWDVTKPILLEKSPPHIARIQEIKKYFEPVYFICMVRNPYAQCESIIKRNGAGYDLEEAARFVIRCLYFQKDNIEKLDNILFFNYEELTDYPVRVSQKLKSFLPLLSDVNISGIFKAHNCRHEDLPIINLNQEKIEQLDKKQIELLNRIFEKHRDIFNYFGYKLIDPANNVL
jgi:hypothetical protein